MQEKLTTYKADRKKCRIICGFVVFDGFKALKVEKSPLVRMRSAVQIGSTAPIFLPPEWIIRVTLLYFQHFYAVWRLIILIYRSHKNPAIQKKVLALHDLSCFGRSSLVPIISVISAMGHQCVPLPTAVFSTHTAIDGWICADLTRSMHPSLVHFQSLGLRFDAVYSGFLGSAMQIDCVAEAAECKSTNGIFLADPVMGDNGAVYTTYTPEMTSRMSELCALADIITPNVTEAAILLGKCPDAPIRSRAEAEDWCAALEARYHAQIVLTGLEIIPDKVMVACHAAGHTEWVAHERVGGFYPGTGDIFASVLLGGLLAGASLPAAAAHAGGFVRDCIAYTAMCGTDPMYGVQLEPLLNRLCKPYETKEV